MSLKDRVFQKSSRFRHVTEIHNQLEALNDSEVSSAKEILLLVTDGGGDHNVTHTSVQLSLGALFLNLNLDMLVAMRTCPTQSWTNLAERVMSRLNIALQNVALERNAMDPQFEDVMRKNNNMKSVRGATEERSGFKTA